MTAADPRNSLEKPDAFSLCLNFLPLLQLVAGLLLASRVGESVLGQIALFVAWVYLAPPLAARALMGLFGKPEGRLTQSMRAYRVWWTLTQLQAVFNRLPWVEEVLRFVPGLYAAWIHIWGCRLSPFAYLGPGLLITDRTHVHVEAGAVLGLRCALAAHMASRDQNGRFIVLLAAPRVEREAIVGGDAGLGPGAVLRAGQMLPTGRRVGPFDEWPRARREAAP